MPNNNHIKIKNVISSWREKQNKKVGQRILENPINRKRNIDNFFRQEKYIAGNVNDIKGKIFICKSTDECFCLKGPLCFIGNSSNSMQIYYYSRSIRILSNIKATFNNNKEIYIPIFSYKEYHDYNNCNTIKAFSAKKINENRQVYVVPNTVLLATGKVCMQTKLCNPYYNNEKPLRFIEVVLPKNGLGYIDTNFIKKLTKI